jgi:hypothetical protein
MLLGVVELLRLDQRPHHELGGTVVEVGLVVAVTESDPVGPLVALLVEEHLQLPVVEVADHDFRFFRFFFAWAFEIFAARVFVIPSRRSASYTFGFLIDR